MLYESHVTVDGLEESEFLKSCASLSVKPVLIDKDTGSGIKQMMTAKFHRCSYEQAMKEMREIAAHFPVVVRLKLETILAPSRRPQGDYLYLEFHSKFIVPEAELDEFTHRIEELGGHTSKNSLKYHLDGEEVYYFATTRDEMTMKEIIKSAGYELVNTLRECVLYDTKPEIDRYWYDCGGCGIKQVQL